MFSWANMVIILFLEPRFVKYEKHLLMWKLISNSCTLSRLCFFYQTCPSRYPRQQPISAQVETEPVFFCKIKHKKHPRRLTVVPPSVSFGTHSSHLSTLCHGGEAEVSTRKPQRSTVLSSLSLILAVIPLICLHSVTEAKQRILYIFQQFLSFNF